jgi:diguanylate cyclase (GGDEF)-like protein
MVADRRSRELPRAEPGLRRGIANWERVIEIVLLVAAGLALAGIVSLAFRLGTRSDRRYDTVLRKVDRQLAPIAETLEETARRADDVRARGDADRELAPALERLLEQIAAEGAPATAFRRVAGGIAPELAGGRRLPKAKQPPTRDELTGVRDRGGYEAELEREIARAARMQRPLSLVLFDLGDLRDDRVRAGHAEVDRLLQEFAGMLVRVTRVTDTVCRRRNTEFGILLPDTTATGARSFRSRVREESSATAFGRLGPVTFSSGIAEWRSDESTDAFDARARVEVGRSAVRPLELSSDNGDEGTSSVGSPHTG